MSGLTASISCKGRFKRYDPIVDTERAARRIQEQVLLCFKRYDPIVDTERERSHAGSGNGPQSFKKYDPIVDTERPAACVPSRLA